MINTVSAAVIFLFSDAEYLSWKAMITIKIKFAAAVTAFAVLACMQSVSAETAENITVLGDSISTGYGLDDDVDGKVQKFVRFLHFFARDDFRDS